MTLFRKIRYPFVNKLALINWVTTITLTGTAQALIQCLGFASGIITIRLLNTREYALYTLANTMLGTMTMFADSGISNGIMSEGGKVWQDKKKLGIVLSTGLDLRMKFGIISIVLVTPILIILLKQHSASWGNILLILVCIVPAFFATLSDTFLEMTSRLHQDIKRLQHNQVQVSVGRSLLSAGLLLLAPFTWVALLANSLPRIYGNIQLRKISSQHASLNERPDRDIKKNVLTSVKRTLPLVVYHCLSGQLSLWLISIFGTTSNLAELGALGRISMIFNLVSTIFLIIVIPRFARMNVNGQKILKYYSILQILTIFTSVIIVLLVWIFSDKFLDLLGSKYSGLHTELLLVSISSAISLLAGLFSQIIISRGWFLKPYLLIAVNIISTALYISMVQTSNLASVLVLNILLAFITYAFVSVFGFIKIQKQIASELVKNSFVNY